MPTNEDLTAMLTILLAIMLAILLAILLAIQLVIVLVMQRLRDYRDAVKKEQINKPAFSQHCSNNFG